MGCSLNMVVGLLGLLEVDIFGFKLIFMSLLNWRLSYSSINQLCYELCRIQHYRL